jgi:hypothetical protein
LFLHDSSQSTWTSFFPGRTDNRAPVNSKDHRWGTNAAITAPADVVRVPVPWHTLDRPARLLSMLRRQVFGRDFVERVTGCQQIAQARVELLDPETNRNAGFHVWQS